MEKQQLYIKKKGRYKPYVEPERPERDNALYKKNSLELWVNVEGYDGKYKVSNCGRVVSFVKSKYGRLMNPNYDRFGYLRVCLKNKSFFVHKLVAKYFVAGYDTNLGVCHKDGDRSNNCYDNLQYVTLKQKMEKIRQAKYTPSFKETPIKTSSTTRKNVVSLEGEIWKDVLGFEGYYQVSNFGRIKSLDRIVNNAYIKGRVLRQKKDRLGYCRVTLKIGAINKSATVHRLVALAFLDNPQNLPCVNHKDENPSNNQVDNLEWCTNLYNTRYGGAIERAADKRRKRVVQTTKQGEFVNEFKGLRLAALELGIPQTTLARFCRGERDNEIYNFRYKEKI